MSVAGAGCIIAVAGVLVIAGDAQAPGGGESGSRTPGIILFSLVVVAGYALMHLLRDAPGASAGVTAVVLGVPPLMVFATIDEREIPPFPIDGVLAVSAMVWLASYLAGPGRGRPLLLGAALVFAWLFALEAVDNALTADLGDPPILSEEPFGDIGPAEVGDGDDTSSGDGGADWTVLGVTSVLFGAGYLALSRVFDRRRLAGAATPFAAVGHVALPAGIVMLGEDLEVIGTGIALALTGGLVCWLGALGGRRATTVIGAAEVIVGSVMVLVEAMEGSSPANVGTALFVLGFVLVAAAHLLHLATGEPPQTSPGPSTFGGRRPGGPGGAVPPARPAVPAAGPAAPRPVPPYAGWPPPPVAPAPAGDPRPAPPVGAPHEAFAPPSGTPAPPTGGLPLRPPPPPPPGDAPG